MRKLEKYKHLYTLNDILYRYLRLQFFKNGRDYYRQKIDNFNKVLVEKKKEEAMACFCRENSKYWEKIDHGKKNDIILTEGFFGEAGPNYVLRVGAIVKGLQEKYNFKPVVLLRIGVNAEPLQKQVWASFYFDEFEGIEEDMMPHLDRNKIYFYSMKYYCLMKIFLKFNMHERARNLSFRGIQIGDMLYDEFAKINRDKSYTVKSIARKDLHLFKIAFKGFFYVDFLCRKYNIKYYVTTHTQYISYGLPARYLAANGAKIVETTDDMTFFHPEKQVLKCHDYFNYAIRESFDEVYKNDALIAEARKRLNARFSGEVEQIDVKMAYCNNIEYLKEDLKRALDIENDNPIVFIFAHVFRDAPCGLSSFQLFSDYYQWTDETVRHCSKISHINWIIKEHPSVDAYGERGEVAKIVKKYQTDKSTIYMCPDDFSSANLKDIALAIVTAQGTAGMEFACTGLPVILTSAPFYKGFGFTNEPETKQEYFDVLNNAHKLKPLADEQIRSALAVFSVFNKLQFLDFKLIDTEVRNLVWGSSGGVMDIPAAYRLVADRLKKHNPRDAEFYKSAMEKC